MNKKKYIFFPIMISIMLCACSNLDNTGIAGDLELKPVCESTETIEPEEETSASAIESVDDESAETIEPEEEKNASAIESVNSESTETVEPEEEKNASEIESINSENAETVEQKEEIYVSQFSSEDFYLLSSNQDFYELISCNPIVQKYYSDNGQSTLDAVQKAYKKCDIWNQQIEYTGTNLKNLLKDSKADTIQNVVDLWKGYYQEKVSLYQSLFGMNGLILGSMYTEIAADILVEDNTLMAYALLSLEYELSGDVHFVEESSEDSVNAPSISWYDFDAESVCPEWSQDFQEILDSYSLNEKNSEELEVVITETANRIQETMGSEGDLVSNVNKYLSIINSLNELEEGVSTDDRYIKVKEERLRLYATQLLNIEYMLEEC